MSISLRAFGAAAALAAALTAPRAASAFGGFYVGSADSKLWNNATQVVVMRDGNRTVVSMQNDYEGPPEGFAMIVPVPVVLQRENVKTLPKDVFDKVDRLTAPRLVEYWEQDPCGAPVADGPAASGASTGPAGARAANVTGHAGVKVEAQFDAGEYDVVVLSAKDSAGLDAWLKRENYKLPSGAETYLRPYVQAGSKFLVARVDPKRLAFDKGRARLSPLRFHYDSSELTLPVRLGLINARGTQDLVVFVLANQRFEPANAPSVMIPTNLDLADGTRDHFGRFYDALFDRTLEKNPKAIVTEYAWNAASCEPDTARSPRSPVEPCLGPALGPEDFATFGADVLASAGPATRPRVSVDPPFGTAPAATQLLVQRRFLPRVAACWANVQPRKPKSGRIDVKIDWTADGKIKEVAVPRNDTTDTELVGCIKKIFDGAALPLEEGSMFAPYTLDVAGEPATRAWTITRLHARYGKDTLGEDIVLKAAPPISGGREVRDAKGNLERGSSAGAANTFQARYAIRHPWVGPIECKDPRRGVWGGPWPDLHVSSPRITTAPRAASADRGGVSLGNFVRTDVPELDVKAGKGSLPPIAPAASSTISADASAEPSSPSHSGGASSGCGSSAASGTGGATGGALVLALVLASAVARRRDSVNNC